MLMIFLRIEAHGSSLVSLEVWYSKLVALILLQGRGEPPFEGI
jgi:hypothetical protein